MSSNQKKLEDFGSLKYNIFSLKSGENVFDKFPELLESPSFMALMLDVGEENFIKVLKYIFLMYDKESPLVKRYQDHEARKRESCVISGIDPESEFGVNVVSFIDEKVSDVLIDFLILQNSRVWAMVISNELTFYEFQKALTSEVSRFRNEKDKLAAIAVKSKLMEDSDIISERLDRYYKILAVDSPVADAIKVKFTPEALAKRNV